MPGNKAAAAPTAPRASCSPSLRTNLPPYAALSPGHLRDKIFQVHPAAISYAERAILTANSLRG
jgi:hypothetical protein